MGEFLVHTTHDQDTRLAIYPDFVEQSQPLPGYVVESGQPEESLYVPAYAPHAPALVSGAERSVNGQWFDADTLDGIREARLVGLGMGQQILEKRMQQLRDGDFDSVPNPVDPLTTANRVLKAKEEYGESSPQYERQYHSLVVDSQRLLAEGMRKLTWEYFPEIEQEYDEQTGGYTFMGRQLLDMVEDGITPVAEPEERQYRIGEYVEEITYGAVRQYGKIALGAMVERPQVAESETSARPDVHIITISECADWAIDAHNRKSKAGYGGYVPEIQKLMIRGVRYDSATGNRFQEQLGLPGTYITHNIVNQALHILGVTKPDEQLSKQEVRAKQLVSTGGEGVLGFAALLDHLASQASGKRIFLGEVIPDGQPKEYTAVKQEAAQRQDQLVQESHALAGFLLTLEEAETDHWESQGLVEHYVKKVIFNQVKHDPQKAGEAFDHQTKTTLQQAAYQRALGNEVNARLLEQQAEANAPEVVFCGAGSCGLEAVNPASKEAAEMKEKLNAKSGDTMLRDTERSCKKCGHVGGVYYVFNSKRVNKGCAKCNSTEVRDKK